MRLTCSRHADIRADTSYSTARHLHSGGGGLIGHVDEAASIFNRDEYACCSPIYLILVFTVAGFPLWLRYRRESFDAGGCNVHVTCTHNTAEQFSCVCVQPIVSSPFFFSSSVFSPSPSWDSSLCSERNNGKNAVGIDHSYHSNSECSMAVGKRGR